MLLSIWDGVLDWHSCNVDEDVSLLEDVFLDPKLTVGFEELCVETVSDSSSVLDITDHVLHGFPGVWLVEVSTLSHVLFQEGQGGLQIRVVEFIWDAESKRSELSSFLDNGVHEADSKHHASPFLIWLNSF